MGVGGGLHVPGIGPIFHHMVSSFGVLHGSANEVNRMLVTTDILDQHGADNVIGGGYID